MIRGISFEIIQETSHVLFDILTSLDCEKFWWYNSKSQTEMWDKPFGSDFFTTEVYDGQSFIKQIQNEHFVVFLKLQAYLALDNFQNLSTYDDFLNSTCQIILLVNDCQYVEIYSKDVTIVESIYERALVLDYSNVEFITDENDERTKMDIL